MAAPMLRNALAKSLGFDFLKATSVQLGCASVNVREASKKAGTSTRNKKSRTRGKHRGPKKYENDHVEKGMILCRQLGLRFYPGENVGCGRDLTLYAMEAGRVVMSCETLSPYPRSPLYAAIKSGRVVRKVFYNIVPEEQKPVFRLVSQT